MSDGLPAFCEGRCRADLTRWPDAARIIAARPSMPTPVTLTSQLRNEYEQLLKSCIITPARTQEVDGLAARLVSGRARYGAVSDATGVPWHVIAVIHCMEASLKFNCHLHNGDPLSARTVQVPAGRPLHGQPPFTWEASATDALTLERLSGDTDWSLA